MRVVVDTNIFISAALKEVSWPAMMVRWVTSNGILLKSVSTEAELMAVIKRPKIRSKMPLDFANHIAKLFAAAEEVTIVDRVTECRDAKDNKFLEVALNGRADVLVSGDADLLVMQQFRTVPIVDAATFIRLQIR